MGASYPTDDRYAIPPEVAELDDDAIIEHTRTLGEPFDGIAFELLCDGIALDEVASRSGGDRVEITRGRVGELVLHGVQVCLMPDA